MKPMTFDSKNSHPFSFSSLAHKRNHVLVKFAAFSLLLGLAFRLFVYNPIQLSSETTHPSLVVQNVTFPPPPNTSLVLGHLLVEESFSASDNITSQNGKWKLFLALSLKYGNVSNTKCKLNTGYISYYTTWGFPRCQLNPN